MFEPLGRVTVGEFISILEWLGVDVAVDVRRFPTSRFEWLGKDALRRVLESASIEYVHFERLGGYREGGYGRYMETEEFKRAFEELLTLIERKNVVIFCSEKLFFKCHRRFIADELARRGVKVFSRN
nr:DUF488 domain-containing protein [Candidatus Freyrarchaeum guaymaensis]